MVNKAKLRKKLGLTEETLHPEVIILIDLGEIRMVNALILERHVPIENQPKYIEDAKTLTNSEFRRMFP